MAVTVGSRGMERFKGGQMSVVDDIHSNGYQLYIEK
jgi:hypothetical protein